MSLSTLVIWSALPKRTPSWDMWDVSQCPMCPSAGWREMLMAVQNSPTQPATPYTYVSSWAAFCTALISPDTRGAKSVRSISMP